MKRLRRFSAAAALLMLCTGAAAQSNWQPTENVWPFRLVEHSPTEPASTRFAWLPPFGFSQPHAGGEASGVRPFFVEWQSSDGAKKRTHVLYPLFRHERDSASEGWSVFELIKWRQDVTPASGKASEKRDERFDVFPFWLSRKSSDPEQSYQALFPIYGTVKNRFASDRIEFVAAPLFIRTETAGANVTWTPWPFFGRYEGTAQGWQLWPLYGAVERANKSREMFAAWPFFARSTKSVEGGTAEYLGVLPFYMRRESPKLSERVYLWPFFGTSEQRQPTYNETRYFWPLFVQGKGEMKTVNRWAPFYKHSTRKDSEKTWLLWPLWRNEHWQEAGLSQEKSQLLFFLFWDLKQQKSGAPKNSPAARKTHLWPLVSHWDNANGRTQTQLLSPLEVFFQHNETMRVTYSPLFAVAQREKNASQDFARTSLLFGLLTHERKARDWHFSLGPLLTLRKKDGHLQMAPLPALFEPKSKTQPQP